MSKRGRVRCKRTREKGGREGFYDSMRGRERETKRGGRERERERENERKGRERENGGR
jgi:hypothetical protein